MGNQAANPTNTTARGPIATTVCRRRWLPTLLVTGMALAACGGGDGEGEPFVSPTQAPSSTTSAPASTTTSLQPTTTTQPPLQLTNNAKLSTAGLGPVRIGMTVEEAERVAGVDLVPDNFGDENCRYYTPDRGTVGVGFMVSDGEVVRVDIFGDSPVTTLSGYGVGSSGEEITAAFTARIQRSVHPYDETGEYLVYVPVDEVDADKRVIWETDGTGTVVAMRSGRIPHVDLIEGCA
jgi:hypothetical protein